MILYLFIIMMLSCQHDKPSKILLNVGRETLTDSDFLKKIMIQELDSVKNSEVTALFLLTKMLAIQEISNKYGFYLNDSILSQETARIDRNTLRPEKIKSIRNICGSEEEFRKLFIKESLLPRWLQLNYQWNKKIHLPEAIKANEKFTEALISSNISNDSAVLDFILTKNELKPMNETPFSDSIIEIIDESRVQDIRLEQRVSDNLIESQLLVVGQLCDAMYTLKPGQFYPRVMELQNAFWIVQLIDKRDDEFYIKVLPILKGDFHSWLESEISKVEITVNDKKLWEKMILELPGSESLFRNIKFN